jgi:hypothetical protein
LGKVLVSGAIAGEYSGRMSSLQGNGSAQMLIARDGLLAGSTSSGCEFRGSVSSDSDVNAYGASVTFNAAPWAVPSAKVTGHALLDEGRLLIALPKQDRPDVVVLFERYDCLRTAAFEGCDRRSTQCGRPVIGKAHTQRPS